MVFGQLHQTIRQAYKKVFQQEPPAFTLEPARSRMFGDFSSNLAMVAAGAVGLSPIAVAQKNRRRAGTIDRFPERLGLNPGVHQLHHH